VYSWDRRFLDLAKFMSKWSKDPSTKTGAVIVDRKHRVVSVGYNGFARGVSDWKERLSNRPTKYKFTVHCEQNSIVFAQRDLTNCVLYTYPFMSCASCAGLVIQSGIVRCVAPKSDNARWADDFKISKLIFKEAGVRLDLVDYP
jgi:dCMP deaminase